MIQDDNPQIKVKILELVDEGNSNLPFIRSFIYDEDGSFLNTVDLDYAGVLYNVVGQGVKSNSGTTTLDLTNILNGVSISQMIDVDTNSVVPTIGQVLTWDGNNWIPSTVSGGGGSSDHGTLTGLADDDHPQYLNESRGDIRYFTKTEINAQQTIQDNSITNNANNINTEVTNRTNADTNLQSQIDASIVNISNNSSNINTNTNDINTHVSNFNNPHQVTITQAIAQDIGTDVTVLELEELTNGSETTLHSHALPFYDYITKVSSNTEVGINNTVTLETYLSLSATLPSNGTYKINWNYVWSTNDGAQDIIVEIRVNGNAIYFQRTEPKDVAGQGAGGIQILTTTGGLSSTGTDQLIPDGGSWTLDLLAGVNTIEILWAGSATNDIVCIHRGMIDIERKA